MDNTEIDTSAGDTLVKIVAIQVVGTLAGVAGLIVIGAGADKLKKIRQTRNHKKDLKTLSYR